MTEGQTRALKQLQEIQQADPHALEVLSVTPPSEAKGHLVVQVSLHCGGLDLVPGGLPLRDRERLMLLVPEDFPFEVPSVWTVHDRFAGHPHVFWRRWLCLYVAPSTEWEPADEMFGFVDRLWIWFKHGAANQLNPVGQPLHPPSTLPSSKLLILPKVDAPKFDGPYWVGFAGVRTVGSQRMDIVSWHELVPEEPPPGAKVPVVLLTKDLPWEMPRKLSDLLQHLGNTGVSRTALLAMLRLGVTRVAEDEPLVFVLGTPQRGIAGTGDFRQHLMAWEVEPLLVRSLRISLSKYSDYPPLREIGEEGERLANEIAATAEVRWCRVMEGRPEVTIQRDHDAPISTFQNRSVCLWGCGALGSHVAYFLAKTGIRRLVVIDDGVVSPGLLVRQMYEDAEIGQTKAEALRTRLLRMRPSLVVESYTHDVLSDLEPGKDWSHGADLVMDCTASHRLQAKLELARTDIGARRVPLISMMVGPRAERGIVVLSPPGFTGGPKDVFRKAKIAVCGERRLLGFADDFYPGDNTRKLFQPEPGCSDATFVGSAADVAALSAIMLNQAAVELARNQAQGTAFFVWQPHLAAANSREQPFAHKTWPCDIVVQTSYEIRISPTAWEVISQEIRSCRRQRGKAVETGGFLFGKRDDALRILWVDAVSGPPSDSKHSKMEFLCGIRGVKGMHERWRRKTRGSVEYVGTWHTHPECKPRPSGKDWSGMAQILTTGDPPPRRCLLLIVGLQGNNPWLGASVFERRTIEPGWHTIEAEPVMKELHDREI